MLKNLFLLAATLLKLFPTGWFAVKDIHCKSQYGPCDGQDINYAQGFMGQNIFFVSTKRVEEELEQNFKNERTYVIKVLPNTLDIVVEKRKTTFGLSRQSANARGVFLVSKAGTILSFETDSALPVLTLGQDYETPVVGKTIGETVKGAGRILDLVRHVQTIKKSKLDKTDLWVTISQGSTNVDAIFNVENDPQVQVGALQLILEKAKMDNKIPGVIDLRFKNPVLKYD